MSESTAPPTLSLAEIERIIRGISICILCCNIDEQKGIIPVFKSMEKSKCRLREPVEDSKGYTFQLGELVLDGDSSVDFYVVTGYPEIAEYALLGLFSRYHPQYALAIGTCTAAHGKNIKDKDVLFVCETLKREEEGHARACLRISNSIMHVLDAFIDSSYYKKGFMLRDADRSLARKSDVISVVGPFEMDADTFFDTCELFEVVALPLIQVICDTFSEWQENLDRAAEVAMTFLIKAWFESKMTLPPNQIHEQQRFSIASTVSATSSPNASTTNSPGTAPLKSSNLGGETSGNHGESGSGLEERDTKKTPSFLELAEMSTKNSKLFGTPPSKVQPAEMVQSKYIVTSRDGVLIPNPNISSIIKRLKGVYDVFVRKRAGLPLQFVVVCDPNASSISIHTRMKRAFKRRYQQNTVDIARNFKYSGPDNAWHVDWRQVVKNVDKIVVIKS